MAQINRYINGVTNVNSNLNRAVSRMRVRSRVAMKGACELVKARAMQMTPVDTGHLRGGADTSVDAWRGSSLLLGTIYYTATYAPAVHEINRNYQKRYNPEAQWKFLEKALVEKEQEALRFMRDVIAFERASGP